MSADTLEMPNRVGSKRSLAWSLVFVLYGFSVGCGFDSSTPLAGGQTVAGTSSSVAGTSATGGAAASQAGSASGGGDTTAGTASMPQAGSDAGSATGGQTAQGGQPATGGGGASAGGSGGSGGMGVAGGPAVWPSDRPLLVVAYSPYRDGQAPGGVQPTQDQVKQDLMMLKPYVVGVRVYGTDGANAYIPALCDQLGIDLHLGAWIDGIASDEPNVHALAAIVNQNHPSIKTAVIGNEVLNRAKTNMMTEDRMIQLINLFKADLTGTPTYKIATADTYPVWMVGRPNLAAAVDLLIWHTYAWWSGADISTAYTLVSSRYDDMLAKYPGKPMVLGETGWPSMVDHMSTDMTTTAVGNEANQATYYHDAIVGFRTRNLPAWFFSAIDEKWKATTGEGEVGAHWGIWDSSRMPKQAVTDIMNIK